MGRQVYGDEIFSESGLSEHPHGLVPGKLGTQRSWNVVLNCSHGEETTSKGWGGGSRERAPRKLGSRDGDGLALFFFFFHPHLNRGSCVLKSPLAPSHETVGRRPRQGWRVWVWGATGSRKHQSFHKKAGRWGVSQRTLADPQGGVGKSGPACRTFGSVLFCG